MKDNWHLEKITSWIDWVRDELPPAQKYPVVGTLPNVPWAGTVLSPYQDSDAGCWVQTAELLLNPCPVDVCARFVILDYLYSGWVADLDGPREDIAGVREELGEYFAHVTHLLPVEKITDRKQIGWELANAHLIQDAELIEQLWTRATEICPEELDRLKVQRARDRFYSVFAKYIEILKPRGMVPFECKPEVWDPDGLYAMGGDKRIIAHLFSQPGPLPPLALQITEKEKESLSYCVVELKFRPKDWPLITSVPLFMLAVSCYAIGDYDGAAKAYEEMLADQSTPKDQITQTGIRRSLARCYQAWGRYDRASATLLEAQNQFPKAKDLHADHAQLMIAQGDYFPAVQLLKEETKVNPQLGEEPFISLALAMAGVAADSGLTGRAFEELTKRISESDVIKTIRAILGEFWEQYWNLGDDTRTQLCLGIYFLHYVCRKESGESGGLNNVATRALASACEFELKRLLEGFRKFYQPSSSVMAQALSEPTWKPLAEALREPSKPARLSLGQMCKIFRNVHQSDAVLASSLRDWLRSEYPGLDVQELADALARIPEPRNKATHTSSKTNATKMLGDCRWLLEIIATKLEQGQ